MTQEKFPFTKGKSKKKGGESEPPETLLATPRVKEVSLVEETRKRYLNYAMSVITSRALPDVRDGLKPVQRRILLAMYRNLKLLPNSKYRKSAAVVGEVMGKYHPHGDQAIYEAMARMAQPFSLRHPLVEGHGNFGSIDGDRPAAMRYTEARLMPVSLDLLEELKQETVVQRPNFDGTLEEPVVLPARFPHLLINGASGIAVGMATNIPPHNLGEVMAALVHLLQFPETSTKQLLKIIKGPDFPTGGEIVTEREERLAIYERGQGNFFLRGQWKEERIRGRSSKKLCRVIITSVPYNVPKSTVVEKIAEVILSRKLPPLLDVRDESTEQIRVVLDVKAGADLQLLMAYLYKHTPLQQRFPVNLTCLVPTPNPEVAGPERLSLRKILEQFLAFRLEVIKKRFLYELGELQKRIHILRGFELLFDDLDEALRIIRQSNNRKDSAVRLMARFDLDLVQVEKILDTRLYRLARLEIRSIREELKKLEEQAAEIEAILESRERLTGVLRQEFEEVQKKHLDPRRTRIRLGDETPELDPDAFIQHEDTHVILTRDGWLKRIRTLNEIRTIRVREGDQVMAVLSGNTNETVCFFSNLGVAYTCRILDIPATTGYGKPIQSLFKFKDGERVVDALSFDPRALSHIHDHHEENSTKEASVEERETRERSTEEKGASTLANGTPTNGTVPPLGELGRALAVTQQAFGFQFSLDAYREPSTRSGRRFARLTRGDEILGVTPLQGEETLILASQLGRVLLFPCTEVKLLGNAGKGVHLLNRDADDSLLGFALANSPEEGLTVETNRGRQIIITPHKFPLGKRNSRGKKLPKVKRLATVVSSPVEIQGFEEPPDNESPPDELNPTDEA